VVAGSLVARLMKDPVYYMQYKYTGSYADSAPDEIQICTSFLTPTNLLFESRRLME